MALVYSFYKLAHSPLYLPVKHKGARMDSGYDPKVT